MKNQRFFIAIHRFSLTCILGLSSLYLQAQAPGREPYSTSDFDEFENQAWYESPLLYIGLILFLGFLYYLLRRNQYRSRHRFMQAERDSDQ